jgi:hypothetical protein
MSERRYDRQLVQNYFAEFMGIKSLAKADDAMRRISEDCRLPACHLCEGR